MNEEKEIKYMTQDIEAGTMLEGLYIAGDMQAKNLTAKKNRKFNLTAKELTTPVAKGGVELNELDENIWTEYRIVTPAGRYTVANKSLWALIDRAEIAMKVSPAKRHRFTILPAEQEGVFYFRDDSGSIPEVDVVLINSESLSFHFEGYRV